jgi:prepilin-type N-terminal cleavage/methylation domain-containing protein
MTSATGKGFTLVELCMTVSVIGLITTLCWPSLRAHAKTIQAKMRADSVMRSLYEVRERAIHSGKSQTFNSPSFETAYLSGPSTSFFADGSAQYFEIGWRTGQEQLIGVQVNESGQISFQED